jgi:hypothetical protein
VGRVGLEWVSSGTKCEVRYRTRFAPAYAICVFVGGSSRENVASVGEIDRIWRDGDQLKKE